MSSFVFCWRKPLVCILLGNCNIRAIQPLTRAASTDQRLYFLCLSIEVPTQRDPELTFLPSTKGLQMKCQPSAPLHKRASEQKRAKEQSAIFRKSTLFCAKNTAEYVFIYELWIFQKCFKSIFTKFFNFLFNGKWRRHLPFANRKPSETGRQGARVMTRDDFSFLVRIFQQSLKSIREYKSHKCFIRQYRAAVLWSDLF